MSFKKKLINFVLLPLAFLAGVAFLYFAVVAFFVLVFNI